MFRYRLVQPPAARYRSDRCFNEIKKFLVCVCFGCFGFTLIQYIPDILDIVKPLNESRPRLLLYQAHYFVKQQKYFYFVIIHDAVGVLISGITGIAAETFSLVNALHAFGMFKITRYIVNKKDFC